MDFGDANWVWWGCGILAVVAAIGFYMMHERANHKITVNIVDEIG
jgi:hypothetical protein